MDENIYEFLQKKNGESKKLREKLENILQIIAKMNKTDRGSLPKFKDRLTERDLSTYLQKLEKSARDPEIQRRISKMGELGILNYENISGHFFQEDEMDTIIKNLESLHIYTNLYGVLSPKLVSFIASSDLSTVNESLSSLIDLSSQVEENCQKIPDKDLRTSLLNNILQEQFSDSRTPSEMLSNMSVIVKVQQFVSADLKLHEYSKIERANELLNDLEGVEIDVGGETKVDNIDTLIATLGNIKNDFHNMMRDYNIIQKLLGLPPIDENDLTYAYLKAEFPKSKEKLKVKVGKGFENILNFYTKDVDSIDVDKAELIEFLKLTKPLMKEVLLNDE